MQINFIGFLSFYCFNYCTTIKLRTMKKLKIHYIIITLIASYFLFNGCIVRKEINNWQKYAIELQSEGWSVKASEHIAKVEFKILSIDEEYNGYKED